MNCVQFCCAPVSNELRNNQENHLKLQLYQINWQEMMCYDTNVVAAHFRPHETSLLFTFKTTIMKKRAYFGLKYISAKIFTKILFLMLQKVALKFASMMNEFCE